MSGLMNVQNSILRQAEAAVEKGVSAVQRQNYHKILVSGMKVALNKGPDGLLAQLKKSEKPIEDVVNGAIGIVGILRGQSRGTMPVAAMVPAAMSLVIQGLDFLERTGVMKITNAELDQATELFAQTLMERMGITAEKIEQLAGQAAGVMNDPEQVAQLKQNMGADNVDS